MSQVADRMRFSLLLASLLLMTSCGASGATSTEQGAIDSLRTAVSSYNATAARDVASTGTACARALTDLRSSSLLATPPSPGKDLSVRRDLNAAYLAARQGFSDCALGARTMNYALMARGDAELLNANGSLQKARSPHG